MLGRGGGGGGGDPLTADGPAVLKCGTHRKGKPPALSPGISFKSSYVQKDGISSRNLLSSGEHREFFSRRPPSFATFRGQAFLRGEILEGKENTKESGTSEGGMGADAPSRISMGSFW